jgi:hypothetical protein
MWQRRVTGSECVSARRQSCHGSALPSRSPDGGKLVLAPTRQSKPPRCAQPTEPSSSDVTFYLSHPDPNVLGPALWLRKRKRGCNVSVLVIVRTNDVPRNHEHDHRIWSKIRYPTLGSRPALQAIMTDTMTVFMVFRFHHHSTTSRVS